MRARRAVAAVLAVLAAPPAAAFDPAVMASVVSVLPDWPDPSLVEEPEGSGVAVLPGGYVVTNDHVIGEAGRIEVRLADGRVLAATIVGRDAPTDIALIRVEADLPVPPIGPTPALAAPVCAIGNPFGLGLSVTCGVVSAVHRTGTGFNPIEDFIQTDAAVNPGGSGGALVDPEGRLVGLVSAIFTRRSDADIGVNFAASMDLVMRVVRDLRDHGRVVRGRTGIGFGPLTEAQRRAGGVGVRVIRVAPGSAAEAAGLRAGDVIVRIGDRAVRKRSDVPSALQAFRIGETVAITVMRDGAERRLTVTMRP